ncbi:MAG: lysophospholipid acyltransferase family protein [Deltaproteobacteria bacterium]|nr:lysophospholipid acyltransferase family protein [Deltaproteobacteria bacterium]
MRKKFTDWLLLNVVPFSASLIIRTLYRLNRIEHFGGEHLRACRRQNKGVIYVSWHDQLLLMVKSVSSHGAKILISSSKDGEIIARTMRYFGHETVRGSSTRGGIAAMREMIALAKGSADLGITPDGPKGPRHQVKPGVVQLARLSGRSILPVAFACSRGRRFNSWDRFLLPFPFGRGAFVIGEPLKYDHREDPEHFRRRLNEAMAETCQQAREYIEGYGLSPV